MHSRQLVNNITDSTATSAEEDGDVGDNDTHIFFLVDVALALVDFGKGALSEALAQYVLIYM